MPPRPRQLEYPYHRQSCDCTRGNIEFPVHAIIIANQPRGLPDKIAAPAEVVKSRAGQVGDPPLFGRLDHPAFVVGPCETPSVARGAENAQQAGHGRRQSRAELMRADVRTTCPQLKIISGRASSIRSPASKTVQACPSVTPSKDTITGRIPAVPALDISSRGPFALQMLAKADKNQAGGQRQRQAVGRPRVHRDGPSRR